MSKGQKKTIFEHTEVVTDSETGEVLEQKVLHTHIETREPDYVKLYLNTILASKDLPLTNNKLLNAILKRMSYADTGENNGGQLVIINEYQRNSITRETKQGDAAIKKGLTSFVKAGILKRLGRGTYQVNPHIFGKGEWNDIKGIRATFHFGDTNEQLSFFEPKNELENESEKD